MDTNIQENNSNSVHYEGIDFLKGILIILVIIGHMKTESLIDGYLHFTIYSLHLTLLIGISGFLLNQHFIENSTLSELFKKYFLRLLLPWLIAWPIFYILWDQPISLDKMILLFFFPLYHLWFVPALFLYIILVWIFKKFKLQNHIILIISIVISLTWYFFFLSGFFEPDSSLKFLYKYFSRLRPYYFCFFGFGLYIRKTEIDLKYFNYTGILVISIFIIRVLFFYSNKIITLDFYLFNFALILFSVLLVRKIKFEKFKVIKWIGKQSLPIYLWHFAFLQQNQISELFGVTLNLALLINYLLMIGVLVLIFLLSKVEFINKYVFGNVLEKRKTLEPELDM